MCRRSISNWRKENSCNAEKLIDDLTVQLDEVQEDETMNTEEITQLKWKLCDAFREEELFWKQKSRALWLEEGDKNTRFFHASTKQRRARNIILGILNQNGEWVESDKEIEQAAVEYFSQLFTSSNLSAIETVLWDIPEVINGNMNANLLQEVTEEEVRQAVFQMNPEKAPGPDGMTPLFYQKFWNLTGKDLLTMVQDFFDTSEFDPSLNKTNMCLIPKTDMPREMAGFRPISLCNAAYKVISKVLTNRLKQIFLSAISET